MKCFGGFTNDFELNVTHSRVIILNHAIIRDRPITTIGGQKIVMEVDSEQSEVLGSVRKCHRLIVKYGILKKQGKRLMKLFYLFNPQKLRP